MLNRLNRRGNLLHRHEDHRRILSSGRRRRSNALALPAGSSLLALSVIVLVCAIVLDNVANGAHIDLLPMLRGEKGRVMLLLLLLLGGFRYCRFVS